MADVSGLYFGSSALRLFGSSAGHGCGARARRGVLIAILLGLVAPHAEAQLTFFVNAETGNNGNNGLLPTAAWRTVSFALNAMPQVAPGAFHTLFIAGRYNNTTGQVIRHDNPLEGWSNGPRTVPPFVQVLYDGANSELDALGNFAPVIFDGAGSNQAMFQFNGTPNEPSSRFDGTNNSADAQLQTHNFHFVNACRAFEILPPLALPVVTGAQPPGAEFQNLRFETCAQSISFYATPGQNSAFIPYLLSATVNQCKFQPLSSVGGQGATAHLWVEAREQPTAPFQNPRIQLTVQNSNFDLGGSTSGPGVTYAMRLQSDGVPNTGLPIGPIGSLAEIVALIDDCSISDVGGGSAPRYGIFAEATGFDARANLTVTDTSIQGTNRAGISYRKTDEGIGSLTVARCTVANCGSGAPALSNEGSGISAEAAHRGNGNGYGAPSTMLLCSITDTEVSDCAVHGIYVHLPSVTNTPNPMVFGTDLSLIVQRCELMRNGTTSSAPPSRNGSGLCVHLEQGRCIGPNTTPLFGPLSRLQQNDVYLNANHGIELRGEATVPTAYGIEFDCDVANNVVDQNGFPSVNGPNLASYDLLFRLNGTNSTNGPVRSAARVVQNTFFDAPTLPLVSYESLGGGSHQLGTFSGNLSAYSSGAYIAFIGFAQAGVPGAISGNFGLFDDPSLAGSSCNATINDVTNFSPAAGGHFLNPALRDYRLLQGGTPGLPLNPAIDRVDPLLTPLQGQDKRGLPRDVPNPVIQQSACPTRSSDAGAHEFQ